jgi:hypothetical protein
MDRKIKEDQLQFCQTGLPLLVGLVLCAFLLGIFSVLIRHEIPKRRIAPTYDYKQVNIV